MENNFIPANILNSLNSLSPLNISNFTPLPQEEISSIGNMFGDMISFFFNNVKGINILNNFLSCGALPQNEDMKEINEIMTKFSEDVKIDNFLKNIFKMSIPAHFVDERTQKIYKNPVLDTNGDSWEKEDFISKNPEGLCVPNKLLKKQISEFLSNKHFDDYKDMLYKLPKTPSQRVQNYFDSKSKYYLNKEEIFKITNFSFEDIDEHLENIFCNSTDKDVRTYVFSNINKSVFFTDHTQTILSCASQVDEYKEIEDYILNINPDFVNHDGLGGCFSHGLTYEEFKEAADKFIVHAKKFDGNGNPIMQHSPYINAIMDCNIEKLRYLREIDYPLPTKRNGEYHVYNIFATALRDSTFEIVKYLYSDEFPQDNQFNFESLCAIFLRGNLKEMLTILFMPAFAPYKEDLGKAFNGVKSNIKKNYAEIIEKVIFN